MNLPIYLLEINEDLMDGSEVDFVALVDKPAIERNFLRFKEDRLSFEIQDEERRIISGPIMLADTPIYRNDNGQEYFVSFPKDTIYKIVKKMFLQGKPYTEDNIIHMKKEAAPPPPVNQRQHHREHVYKSRQLGLI